MKELPTVRASFLEPFYIAAQNFGSPAESVLQSVGLPAQLPEEKELLLLEVNCWRFVHSIAKKEYCSTFGLIACETKPWTEIITIQPLFKDCLNLYKLLQRLVIIAPTQSLTSRFSLVEGGEFIWFVNLCPQLLSDKESIQVELFDLLGMIQLVQACAGKNWRPEEIHLTVKYDYEILNASQFNPSRILFSMPHAKIKIPRKLLTLPVSKEIADKCITAEEMNSVPRLPGTFIDQLVAALIPYLSTGVINKQVIANALGISVRTLQRRLQFYSLSYSTVTDLARFKQAKKLLKNNNISMIEISLMLGYQNASSFTRAFRRLSGVSPKEFRLFRHL